MDNIPILYCNRKKSVLFLWNDGGQSKIRHSESEFLIYNNKMYKKINL